MHDITDIEARGIPGLFVASDEFIEAAEAQGRSLGFAPAAHYVPHPIQGRSDAEIRQLVDQAWEEILERIVDATGSG